MKYLVFLSAAWILYSCQPAKPVIHVLANETNDLVNVLNKNYHLVFHQSPIEAVADAAQGEAILILASSYPQETTTVDEYFYEQVKSKELRAYIEYPSSVP